MEESFLINVQFSYLTYLIVVFVCREREMIIKKKEIRDVLVVVVTTTNSSSSKMKAQ